MADSPADRAARDAIGPLMDEFGGRVYGLALRITGNPADAEDITQETFLQAYRKWDQFEGRASPGTWLYTIAARLARKRAMGRAPADRTMPSLGDLAPFDESESLELPGKDEAPIDLQIRREAISAVEHEITRLPLDFRLPLVLKDVLELSGAEVAEMLGIKPATVKTRVFRARMMLRKALMARLPRRPADAPSYEKQVCLDLLRAKLDAQDQGRGFPLGQDVLCRRCQAVFDELDLAQDACVQLAGEGMPDALRQNVERVLQRAEE